MADNDSVFAGNAGAQILVATDDIGGVKHQRVKLEVGADGAASDVQPPDGDGLAATRILPSGGLVYDSGAGTWYRLTSGRIGDAEAGARIPAATPFLYNGQLFDRQRGNEERLLLASAARTVSTGSATQTNYNCRGLLATIWLTANAGAISITPYIYGHDGWTGQWTQIGNFNGGSPITALGYYSCLIYPGIGTVSVNSTFNTMQPFVVPRTWGLYVQHNNANSVTYQVGACLIV